MFTVGAILLAAGRSTRMQGDVHKLLADINGQALVRRSAMTLLASRLAFTVVVTGSRREEIERDGLPIATVFNENYEFGMGTSLACGLSHSRIGEADGILVMLADMARIWPDQINFLMEKFELMDGRVVVRACRGTTPGHPVILPRCLFSNLRGLIDDAGGARLIKESGVAVHMIDIGDAATSDVDTLDDLVRERETFRPNRGS